MSLRLWASLPRAYRTRSVLTGESWQTRKGCLLVWESLCDSFGRWRDCVLLQSLSEQPTEPLLRCRNSTPLVKTLPEVFKRIQQCLAGTCLPPNWLPSFSSPSLAPASPYSKQDWRGLIHKLNTINQKIYKKNKPRNKHRKPRSETRWSEQKGKAF